MRAAGLLSDREGVETDKWSRIVDTMDMWDEDKLRSVVSAKGNPRTTTDIVCKYFVEAIETQKYGWFWECPNGELELID